MRLLSISLLLVVLGSQQPLQKSHLTQRSAPADQRGTQDSPVVVKVLPTTKTPEEVAEDKQDRDEKTSNDRNMVIATRVLAAIGLAQLFVFGYQAYKLRQTVNSAQEQSEAMGRYIVEAARSANAMERVASAIQSGNAATMRAYVSVVIGLAHAQDRQNGIKFEGKPNLVNTGGTPARNVHIRIASAIVPFAEADNFAYPLPEESAKSFAVAAPHQSYNLSAVVRDFIPDQDIADIKSGKNGKGALTVWGIISYEDIFGEHHVTKFGQWLFFNPDNTVYGVYIPGQNDMD